MTGQLKIAPFPTSEAVHTTCGIDDGGIRDDVPDITTGGTTWCLMALSGVRAGYDTTGPATQVGLRPVKSGLGGHDDGASVVDEGVEDTSI